MIAAAASSPGLAANGPAFDSEWVRIPAGSFQMGCVRRDKQCRGAEKPRHRVQITKPFDLMATEATLAMFQAYAAATGEAMPPQPEFNVRPDQPAVSLKWGEAAAFCAWAGGRLPTEAEWEYAARAGHDWIYPWGNNVTPIVNGRPAANVDDEAANRVLPNPYPQIGFGISGYDDGQGWTSPVRTYPPNAFGLYDIGGNAVEWVHAAMYYQDDYEDAVSKDPPATDKGPVRVARGGAWNSRPAELRVSYRRINDADQRLNYNGVRCARDVTPATR